ncbi:PRC-barrel domain containing protein [Natronococcus wangiae]|uniref:PRC-barrel domain containing protein n=1 Tax=Natronococcus wangiae TaxID=3068275 RepID=UPI00273F9BF9|nr:PRC-barrel domain containing protein [Natronococcus sp. AD5]
MARDFTDDDRDKDVVTAEGNRIGTIRDVNEGRATVDRDSDQDLTDKVKDLLGWDNDESNELRSEHVDTYDDEVQLRRP